MQINPDRRLSELEDVSVWAEQQLQPRVPGELRGTSSGTTTTTASLSAEPGQYELHLVCAGLPEAELSVSTWRGVEVLAPCRCLAAGACSTRRWCCPPRALTLRWAPVAWTAGSHTGSSRQASPDFRLNAWRAHSGRGVGWEADERSIS